MGRTARSSIDSAGRLVIPKAVRREAGLQPGTPLEIRVRRGVVEIQPAPVELEVAMRGNVAVAVPTEPVSPLTSEDIERHREELLEERTRRWLP